jgi:hypothetical protein
MKFAVGLDGWADPRVHVLRVYDGVRAVGRRKFPLGGLQTR